MAAEILETTVESKFLPLELFQGLMNFLASSNQWKNIKPCPPSHKFKLKYSNVCQSINCYNMNLFFSIVFNIFFVFVLFYRDIRPKPYFWKKLLKFLASGKINNARLTI